MTDRAALMMHFGGPADAERYLEEAGFAAAEARAPSVSADKLGLEGVDRAGIVTIVEGWL